jgi:hypothetical protein
MGSGRANYIELLKKDRKTPSFWPHIELFSGKKSIIHRDQWRERKEIEMTIPDKPGSRMQKYRLIEKEHGQPQRIAPTGTYFLTTKNTKNTKLKKNGIFLLTKPTI